MGGRDYKFQIVYSGETLPRFVPGGYVMFQRSRSAGGGFWLGQTCDGVFLLTENYPMSYADAFMLARKITEPVSAPVDTEPDDQLPLF